MGYQFLFKCKFLLVFLATIYIYKGFSGGSDGKDLVKNPPAMQRPGFSPWVGKIPWRRAWQPFPAFLPGEYSWTEKPGWLQSLGSQRVGHD